MSTHLIREIDGLKKSLLGLSALVEERLRLAVKSLEARDAAQAAAVVERDFEIDQWEVDVEEECLKILALHQPVATDLRFIVAILKINNDLERIGDLAVNIAERAVFLAGRPPLPVALDFLGMAAQVRSMFRRSLDAFVEIDVEGAVRVCADDDGVDACNREMYDLVKDGIRAHPECLDQLIHSLSISRHLERIADQATNIAEDVIYMATGDIVRHKTEDYTQQK